MRRMAGGEKGLMRAFSARLRPAGNSGGWGMGGGCGGENAAGGWREIIASGDVGIAPGGIGEGWKSLEYCWEGVAGGSDQEKIEFRVGEQARHGGAADMVDIRDVVLE